MPFMKYRRDAIGTIFLTVGQKCKYNIPVFFALMSQEISYETVEHECKAISPRQELCGELAF